MAISAQKSGLMPNLAKAGYFMFAVPVGLAIFLAVWLTAAAAYENVKFARCTDQMYSLIEMARGEASKEAGFGGGTGEDLVDDLVRRGQLPAPPVNDWSGALRAQVPVPPFMRIEADVPAAACRRLALEFGKDANPADPIKMEAREENGKWTAIYDSSAYRKGLDYRLATAACGEGSYATFALTIALRR
jgi:hypothetical protein